MHARILLFFFLLPLFASAQEVTLYMGNGVKAYYTPPAGFKKGIDNNGEYSFSTADSRFYITLNTKWINGRTPAKILEESLSGLQMEACENMSHKTEVSEAVWKTCRVKVGPRTEGRVWMVICFKDVRNAVEVAVHFQELNEVKMAEIKKSLEGIRFGG